MYDIDDIRMTEIHGYPHKPRHNELCPCCQQDVVEDETLFNYQGDYICKECFIDTVEDLLKFHTEEFARLNAYDMKKVGE